VTALADRAAPQRATLSLLHIGSHQAHRKPTSHTLHRQPNSRPATIAGQATFSVRTTSAGVASYTAKTPTASVGLDIDYATVRPLQSPGTTDGIACRMQLD